MRLPRSREGQFVQRRDRIVPPKSELHGELKSWPLELVDMTFVEEWRLIRTPSGSVHLVGRFSPGGRLNASLPLASLNLASRSVVTLTGKKLRLHGEPGCSAIGKCIASMYGIFDKRMLEAQDVTDAGIRLMG